VVHTTPDQRWSTVLCTRRRFRTIPVQSTSENDSRRGDPGPRALPLPPRWLSEKLRRYRAAAAKVVASGGAYVDDA